MRISPTKNDFNPSLFYHLWLKFLTNRQTVYQHEKEGRGERVKVNTFSALIFLSKNESFKGN